MAFRDDFIDIKRYFKAARRGRHLKFFIQPSIDETNNKKIPEFNNIVFAFRRDADYSFQPYCAGKRRGAKRKSQNVKQAEFYRQPKDGYRPSQKFDHFI